MSSKNRQSIGGPGIQVDPSNLLRVGAQLQEYPFITENEIRKIWGDGVVGSMLMQNLQLVRQHQLGSEQSGKARRKDSEADSGYEFDDGRGSQAKYQPRPETHQFRKRRHDEEEDSYQETGRGQNKQKRRRGSDNEGWDDQNDQQEDRRGWNAKVQPRTESGQFKKTRDNGDGNESDNGGQLGRPRRRRASVEHDEDDLNRHGDFRGWNAKVQPRRASGQFKKQGEEDELSSDERGGRGGNQRPRRRRSRSRSVESNSGQGSAARFLPRTATGQFKPKGEQDELGQRHQRDNDNEGEQIGRPRRRRASSVEHGEEDLNRSGDFRGWQAKQMPRRATGQFKRKGEEDELSDNEGGGRGRKQQRRRRSRSREQDEDEFDSGTGRRGRPRRREQSEDRDEENFNRRGNFRGSSAKAQPRTEAGQFKKTQGRNDDDDYEDDEDDGRGRGGNRSGAGGQGSTARSLPRTESGQFKKKGERDELGERENSDRDTGRGGRQSGRQSGGGGGFIRGETGQYLKTIDDDENYKRRKTDRDAGQFGLRKQPVDPDWEDEPWDDPSQETHTPGWNAKSQPRRETGQFKKKGQRDDWGEQDDEEEEEDGDGRGNRSGGGQGSAARSLPRTESGQFKKKGKRDDLGQRDDSDEDQGSRGGNQRRTGGGGGGGSDNRGKAAQFLPRTETGQFKKRGEPDELGQRNESDDDEGDRRQTGDESGRGKSAQFLPRTETGQFKPKGERDELGQRNEKGDQGGRSGQDNQGEPGWNAKYQPRDPETGQFQKTSDQSRSQNSGNRGGGGGGGQGQGQSGNNQSKGRSNTNENEAQREPGWNAKYQPRDPETGQFKPSSEQQRDQFKKQEMFNRQQSQNQDRDDDMDIDQPTDGRRREAVKADQKVKQLAELDMLPE